VDALRYTWHVNTLNGNQAATIRIAVTGLHNNSNFSSGFANLVYEPGSGGEWRRGRQSVQYQSDGFGSGARWFSTGGTGMGTQGQPQPLSCFVQQNPDAVILQITLGNGGSSGATGSFEAGADNLILGFRGKAFKRYDFDV
jgi:hypothetical protein